MWIIPKNYQPSSVFVLATVESKEDLSLQGLNIESSLMWRSKPSPLRTWSQRWSRVSWFRLLSTRILKPSHLISFETQLTSSLEDIRANRLAWQEKRKPLTIPDTSSPTSSTMSEQLDLLSASSRMSKDTSTEDLNQSSKTWKAQVTIQRGEYSQRKKLAHLIRENASSYWPTPVAQDDNKSPEAHMRMKANMKGGPRYKPTSLQVMVKGIEKGLWPTPTVQDSNKATKKMRTNHQNNLTAVVFNQNLPTPTARDWKGGYTEKSLTRKDGKSRRFDALPNAAIGGVGTDIVVGHLNPTWVEWLMGVPTGWTDLDSWVTELSPKQPPEHGRS